MMLPQLFRVCIVKILVDIVFATSQRMVLVPFINDLLLFLYIFLRVFFIFASTFKVVIFKYCLFPSFISILFSCPYTYIYISTLSSHLSFFSRFVFSFILLPLSPPFSPSSSFLPSSAPSPGKKQANEESDVKIR